MADARPLDLTRASVDVGDLAAFEAFIAAQRGAAPALVGGYLERRGIYAASDLFAAEEPRIVHLGVDVWTAAGTPVRAPLAARVHSLADNDRFGDYGGTVVLTHDHGGRAFHTLYGHLARRSLHGLEPGQTVARGEVVGWLGEPHENGGWPAHLHLQWIRDMGDHQGDYPGVVAASAVAVWRERCPDPAPLLV
jgi:murein DD-endopeptidase MepM/ murein hydrolase activator NlpD